MHHFFQCYEKDNQAEQTCDFFAEKDRDLHRHNGYLHHHLHEVNKIGIVSVNSDGYIEENVTSISNIEKSERDHEKT